MSAETVPTAPIPALVEPAPAEAASVAGEPRATLAVQPWIPQNGRAEQAAVGDRAGIRRQVWALRGIWLGLCALGVGAAGEVLLFQEPLRVQGALVIAFALVLAALAWSGIPGTALLMPAAGPWKLVWRPGLLLRLAGITGAAALAVGMILAYLDAPNE